MMNLNETHDPSLKSWVSSANQTGCDFPIQNLPFAVFKRKDSDEEFRGGVAIGDQIVDLKQLTALSLIDGLAGEALNAAAESTLNRFMDMGQEAASALRLVLSRLLREGNSSRSLLDCLVAQSDVVYDLPAIIGDYTDFYTSIYHATNVGKQFRPDNPLLPNYKWVPIGYHGRSSSIRVSGENIRRPKGQTKAPDAEVPTFSICKRLDYELELGIYIGKGNTLGEAIALDDSEQHVFGFCLFNDWSARDIQGWEYQPLGPFLSKNFASTVSPWIVTLEAMAPYRLSWTRDPADPQPLPYLESVQNREQGAFDIQFEVLIQTEQMRQSAQPAVRLANSNFCHSYWTVAQMVAHHTVNGCNLRAGDFFGSGTQSGPEEDQAGSMLELSKGGKQPIELGNGEQRSFLNDGDCIIFKGWCEKAGAARIGFGSVEATVLPAN